MATIIQTSPNSFIAGDPANQPGDREHWCGSCAGSGLDYDYNDELTVCYGCCGSGVTPCDDVDCPEHAPLD